MSLARSLALVAGIVVLEGCTIGTVTASSRDGFAASPPSPNYGTYATPSEPKAPAPSARASVERATNRGVERAPRVR